MPPLHTEFLDALQAVSTALAELGSPAMIIGGVAVIAHGVPRLTVDIDATVVATECRPVQALAVLGRHGMVPRVPDAVSFAEERQVLLCEHVASGTPVDLSFGWLPFEEEALRARTNVTFADVTIPVARPEDLVIYKLVASRPRDVDDAEALVRLHGRSMNVERIQRVVAEFAALLDDDDRPRTLARLLRQTGFG